MSELPPVVDAGWAAEHLHDEDVLFGDVRGPNAHIRAHLPRSIPLVLGAPPPTSEPVVVEAFATEVVRRLGRHGVTGNERLVLYDGGNCSSASAAAQAAELAGHPRVAVLVGGLAAWEGELETGPVELQKTRPLLEPRLEAVPTLAEIASRLDDPRLVLLDVRGPAEYSGRGGYPCDPRQGHIRGARLLEHTALFTGPGQPVAADEIRRLVGDLEGAEIVAYCHSGSRSGLATLALRSAGYAARNYTGSWHEWSRHGELPAER